MTRPAIVIVKAADPLSGTDGTAAATLATARVLADHADLHLVTFGSHSNTAPSEIFRSVTQVRPDHQRSARVRLTSGLRYGFRDAFGIEPWAHAVESCAAMADALRGLVDATGSGVVLAEHWTLSGAVLGLENAARVVRLIDVEHDNLLHRAAQTRGIQAARLGRRAEAVRDVEIRACDEADLCLTVSQEDADHFEAAGASPPSFVPIPARIEDRASRDRPNDRIGFLGRLDWWPNQEGLAWFLDEIWPMVREQRPDATLTIAGAGTPPADLDRHEAIEVVGFVPNLADFFDTLSVGIVPISGGTGVKMKTIDLMRHGVPVVSTTTGARGTAGLAGGALIADDSTTFADEVVRLLADPSERQVRSSAAVAAVRAFHDRRTTDELAERLLGLST